MDREKANPPQFNRRSLLQAMAASLALAAAGGREARADERALPYINTPEFVIPGKPKWYATSVRFAGYLQPVLGKTEVGRPVKLEGNPDHPATRGTTDIFMQAALLGLYDPGRSQLPLLLGQPATWSGYDAAVARRIADIDKAEGDGLRLLTGAVSSPTFARQIDDLQKRWPKARWHAWEPIDEQSRLDAAMRVFGKPMQAHPDLSVAEVIVSLDDDFLGPGPRQAMQARAWSSRRQAYQKGGGACRLFMAEPTPSVTGTRADDRLIVSSRRIAPLLLAIARVLGVVDSPDIELRAAEKRWLSTVLTDLSIHSGSALVTIGSHHGVELQALGLLINERLGGYGKTIAFTDPVLLGSHESLLPLVEDMTAGRVSTLLILDADPVQTTPGGLNFKAALEKVEFSLHAGLYADATAKACHWHIPLQHDLESWSDGRAPDGTAAIVQPLIRPFYDVRSVHVVIDRWLGGTKSDHDIVQATWKDGWHDALLKGFVEGSAPAPMTPTIADRAIRLSPEPTGNDLIIEVRPDPTIWDGRYANNAWLQEAPKPLTKVTWGNVILVSPSLAGERHIKRGEELRLRANGRELIGAAWIMPGQEARTLTLSLGGEAPAFLDAANPWRIDKVSLEKTGRRQLVATTQQVQDMSGFDYVKTVETFDGSAASTQKQESFYPQRTWDSPSWGMSIDLDLCIGCNACLVACMAENNVPVVGKELVAQGREMHWLRIDHYYEGDAEAPRSHFQPVPCMHCEQAPCEMGCPVNATVHTHDGLNMQVYNRCIGTRTCSAYCPYKVRRFNWFEYTGNDPESIRAMRNPDVTVRSRGVMEKCTYCVQRISVAHIAAKIAGKPLTDGDVVTACQQACPTQAIVFGDVADPRSAVSQRKASPRNYSLIEEANTRPRTTYLARIGKGSAT